jgi:hypothetical protein
MCDSWSKIELAADSICGVIRSVEARLLNDLPLVHSDCGKVALYLGLCSGLPVGLYLLHTVYLLYLFLDSTVVMNPADIAGNKVDGG